MKTVLLFIFLFYSLICPAQDVEISQLRLKKLNEFSKPCGGLDSIMAKKGRWKKVEDHFPLSHDKTSFPASQNKFVYIRLDSIQDLLKNSIPDLSGMEVTWYRTINNDPLIANGPVPYNITSSFFSYSCNHISKKIMPLDETTDAIYFFINRLNYFFNGAYKWKIDDSGKEKTVLQLPPVIGKWKGMNVYQGYFLANSHSTVTCNMIVIGRNGKLPWRCLTQKEYLTGLKNYNEERLKESKPGGSREGNYKEQLKYINDYLATENEDTLSKAAIIHPKAGTSGFKGKFGNDDEGGFRMVLYAANAKYFDVSLPRYVPQLIQVMWTYDKAPVGINVKKQFEENFPLEKLKAMIDK